LHHFLVTEAGPVEPIDGGWRFSRDGCHFMAFPSGPLDTLDIAAQRHAHRHDRVAYIYRGQVTDRRPAAAVALGVIANRIVQPFKGGIEPGYVVVIASDCPNLPNLPWAELD
ncbi:MAG TPA: hypothetical protein VFW13_11540, partial [Phenylobacterium sp.]|nr:hypothetical protein [Phenylobacterium sp.]